MFRQKAGSLQLQLSSAIILLAIVLTISYSLNIIQNQNYILVRGILLRGIAVINFCALYSLSLQLQGLIGSHGLIPLQSSLKKLHAFLVDKELLKNSSASSQQIAVTNPSLVQPYQQRTFLLWSHQIHQFKIRLIKIILWGIYERFEVNRKDSSSSSNSSGGDRTDGNDTRQNCQNPQEAKESDLFQLPSPARKSFAPADSSGEVGGYDDHLLFLIRLDLVLALLLVLYPSPILFIYHYFSYYAYQRVLSVFLNFQWDLLLLESLFLSSLFAAFSFTEQKTFLEIFFIWCYRLLFFRLMFGSGMVKGYGRDESWNKEFTAMSYHFLTQPLPSNLGRWQHLSLSKNGFQYLTIFTLISEIIFPLCSLWLPLWSVGGGGQYLTLFIFWVNVILQLAITFSGYYGFFSYLTIVLACSLLNDEIIWDSWLLKVIFSSVRIEKWKEIVYVNTYAGKVSQYLPFYLSYYQLTMNYLILFPILCLIVFTYFVAIIKLLERTNRILPTLSSPDDSSFSEIEKDKGGKMMQSWSSKIHYQFELVYNYLKLVHEFFTHLFFVGHHYGLFAVMTKIRYEINIYIALKPLTLPLKSDKPLQAKSETSNEESNISRKDVVDMEEDGLEWELIHFKFKPDNIYLPPKAVRPFFHMPRLDWRLWFLSFKPSFEMYPKWFYHLLIAIMEFNTIPPSDRPSSREVAVLSLLHEETRELLSSFQEEVVKSSSSASGQYQKKEMIVKVTRSVYEFNPSHHDSSIWIKKQEKNILSPMNITQLYHRYDQFCLKEEEGITSNRKTEEKPTVDTAADLLTRTFRKFAQLKKKAE